MVQRMPCAGQLLKEFYPKVCDSIIFPRRPGVGFYPAVANQSGLLKPIEQWIKSTFYYDEIGIF